MDRDVPETYNSVIGDTVGLGPTVHDEGIVDSNDNDLVNALGLDLVNVLNVRRNVRATASGGESTGDRDKDDLLVLELYGTVSVREYNERLDEESHTLAGVVVGGSTAGREFSNLRSGLDVAEEDPLREVIADLELRHIGCVCVVDGVVCLCGGRVEV